ncbi:MAG: protein-L-isoaspartate(D-aspartate) O-methyltransferase [Planctomycetota bacterium]
MTRTFLLRLAILFYLWWLGPACGSAQTRQELDWARNRMVDEEIVAAGVKNPRVIEAMRTTPRHEFVSLAQRKHAYYDMAMPIGHRQTISPPFVVAYMTEQLDPQPTDKVLEIGTGSGYQAAVLSGLVAEVYTIEIVEPLGRRAARTLRRLRYDNVQTKVGDGFLGWPEHAPFDKIIVTCSPEGVPKPLVEQLREGGRMVIPVGERYQQNLYLFQKTEGRLVREALLPTLVVPRTGEAEERRQVQPDPANPSIRNGDFEKTEADADKPAGWHYQRQLELISNGDAPSGNNYVTFTNSEPGRGCRALQGFAVDGREVKRLKLTLHVRGEDIRSGVFSSDLPAAAVTFYDENRATTGQDMMGPWRGTFSWRQQSATLDVPLHARAAILRIGLLGATGEISFDAIELAADREE